MEGVGEREIEEGGICVYSWLIHTVVQQKVTQHCQAIILQLKKFLKQERQINTDMYRNKFERTDTQMLIVAYGRMCCFSKVSLLYVFSNFP